MRFRHIHPRSQAEPEAPRAVTALEFHAAALFPDYSGWWVYALGHRDDGHIFRAGQSESLLRRLDDYRRTYPEAFDLARVWLIKVRDESEADLVELNLINYYQPEYNTAGRAEDLRRITHGRVRGGRMPGMPAVDSGQATA